MDALRQWLGFELGEVSPRERLVSAVGGLFGLAAVLAVSHHALGLTGPPMLVASMGASAVLLFGVPHGQLSQPWPVVAGHLASAAIGVTCSRLIHDREIAAACAVGLALGVMHVGRCIHPPGGATALTAVMGGPAVTSLGYGFVLRPVLLNAVTIVAAAVAYNALFPWRRYPAHWGHRRTSPARPTAATTAVPRPLSHDDVRAALRSLDSFVDITEDDLVRLHELLSSAERGHDGAP